MSKKIANVKELTRKDWLELRKKSIGGSDAATCAGLNPWSDRLTLWCNKKGMLPEQEDNERMRLGRDLEQYVADRFMDATGKKVQVTNFMYASDDYDFITANIDRVVVGENAALECKTMSEFAKYDLESGELPRQYYCQLQHYMGVMGYDFMYIAVLQFGRGFWWHKVERNEVDINALIEAETDFWNNFVLTDIQPDADGSDSSMDTLQTLHPRDNGMSMLLQDEDADIKDLLEVQAAQKRLKSQEQEIKTKLCDKLGDFSEGRSDRFVITWKAQQRTSVDSKFLKSQYPDIYPKVIKTTETRVFRTREIKAKEAK